MIYKLGDCDDGKGDCAVAGLWGEGDPIVTLGVKCYAPPINIGHITGLGSLFNIQVKTIKIR